MRMSLNVLFDLAQRNIDESPLSLEDSFANLDALNHNLASCPSTLCCFHHRLRKEKR